MGTNAPLLLEPEPLGEAGVEDERGDLNSQVEGPVGDGSEVEELHRGVVGRGGGGGGRAPRPGGGRGRGEAASNPEGEAVPDQEVFMRGHKVVRVVEGGG